jgi:hypothetical protein
MNFEIETSNDKIMNTNTPQELKIDTSQIELHKDSTTPRDEYFKSEKNLSNVNFDFLANKNKITSPKDEIVTKLPDVSSQNFELDLPLPLPPTPTTPNLQPLQPPPLSSMDIPPNFSGSGMGSFGGNFLESIQKSVMSEDDIRREKSYSLHQYEKKNANLKYSPKHFTMNDSLEDIKNELEYINNKKSMENSLSSWKNNMFFVMNGVNTLNNTYDPFDVDCSDWVRDFHYEIFRQNSYDETLEELIVKWKGNLPNNPEMKLGIMIASSLGNHVMNKRQEKSDKLKRQKEDEMITQKVSDQVQIEMQKMYQQFARSQPQPQMYQQHTPSPQPQQQQQLSQHQQSPTQHQPQQSPTQHQPQQSPDLHGPSLDEETLLKLVQQDLETLDDAESVADSEGVPKQKRGRPRKEKVENEEPKKRGRPPKSTLVISPNLELN